MAGMDPAQRTWIRFDIMLMEMTQSEPMRYSGESTQAHALSTDYDHEWGKDIKTNKLCKSTTQKDGFLKKNV